MQIQNCCTGRLLQALKALHCAVSRGGDLVGVHIAIYVKRQSGSSGEWLRAIYITSPATSVAQDAIYGDW